MAPLTQENLRIVRNVVDNIWAGDPHSVYPTDSEVMLCVEVFNQLIDIGNNLGQSMLSTWAATYYQCYNNIAYARKLK